MGGYTYKVIVADNFHYQDEEAETEGKTYASCKEATEACRKIVRACLPDIIDTVAGLPLSERQEVFKQYASFGDDPFIISTDPRCDFNAWSYVRGLCKLPKL